MKKEHIEIVKSLLFAKEHYELNLKLYAIVDSLRDKKITEKLIFSGLEYIDLWDEEISSQAQGVPLHLVEISEDAEILDYLLEHDKESIATYFLSPYDLDSLQSYYATFTLPKIEDTENNFKKGVFGFYDPNILPNYLQTLYSSEKRSEFFKGIAVCFVPLVEENDALYIAYHGSDETVNFATIDLSQVNVEEHSLKLNFNHILLPNSMDMAVYVDERVIDNQQVQMFKAFSKRDFLKNLFEEYQEDGEVFYHSNEKGMVLASTMFDEAKEVHNIHSEAGMYSYILLRLIVLKPLQELTLYHTLLQFTEEWEKVQYLREELETLQNKVKELTNEH